MYTVTIYFIQFALIGIGLILPLVYFSMNQSDINKSCLVCIIIALCHKYMIKLKVVSELFSLLRPPNTKTETSMITIDVRVSQSEICLSEKNCVRV